MQRNTGHGHTRLAQLAHLELGHALLLELAGRVVHDVRGPLAHRCGVPAKEETGRK